MPYFVSYIEIVRRPGVATDERSTKSRGFDDLQNALEHACRLLWDGENKVENIVDEKDNVVAARSRIDEYCTKGLTP